MMTIRFTDDHEWARDDDGIITVGITDFAQQQLGEVVYVELPDIDRVVAVGEEVAVVESVKAAGEVKSPVSGTVVAVNEDLNDSPELVNDDPSGNGWFYKISPSGPDELNALMDETAYEAMVSALA
ncbi:MAG: glycine cleavage system protein GcvH [Pseudomonadota bacterium]